MKDRFQGQVAVVTGGADGIGKAVVARLVAEGAAVTVLDHDAEKSSKTVAELSTKGFKIEAIRTDISDEMSVRDSIDSVVKKHGRIDIAINSAGIVGPNAIKTAELDTDEFDRVYQINLRGSFLVLKHALPSMLKQNYGRVLLVASIAGKEGNAGMLPYSMSKAGVIGIVKSAGKEYAETGVTVNGIAPAVIRTSMVDSMQASQVKYMTDKIPMKRCGTLEEAAAMICWIVSKEASFTTGFTFDLSGGRATY